MAQRAILSSCYSVSKKMRWGIHGIFDWDNFRLRVVNHKKKKVIMLTYQNRDMYNRAIGYSRWKQANFLKTWVPSWNWFWFYIYWLGRRRDFSMHWQNQKKDVQTSLRIYNNLSSRLEGQLHWMFALWNDFVSLVVEKCPNWWRYRKYTGK